MSRVEGDGSRVGGVGWELFLYENVFYFTTKYSRRTQKNKTNGTVPLQNTFLLYRKNILDAHKKNGTVPLQNTFYLPLAGYSNALVKGRQTP